MRFACLGSGSRGNALVLEAGQTRLLVDCGFSLKETQRRLAQLGLEAQQLDAVLVTHEHGDHLRGVARLADRFDLAVWATRGTASFLDCRSKINVINVHKGFRIGGIEVSPFPVPHDAREPCQFVFSHKKVRFGMLTDTGSRTPHIENQLAECDGLFLECNYDADMLAEGPYPASLKARVGGNLGHLSNDQAAEILESVVHPQLQEVVIGHISEKNNTADLARGALSAAIDCEPTRLSVASQDEVTYWRTLD